MARSNRSASGSRRNDSPVKAPCLDNAMPLVMSAERANELFRKAGHCQTLVTAISLLHGQIDQAGRFRDFPLEDLFDLAEALSEEVYLLVSRTIYENAVAKAAQGKDLQHG